ncbi:MAG: SAM-dependent chlorinase/fluorinase [Bryobacterales bacterium]|nr:SAM-dependent chlorinase/fluorinase [Bryobacterales bacterium]
MPRCLITLTTDFGTTDHFTGVMKGVILGINSTATIVDITHGVKPQEIAEGAFVIAQTYRYFPRKTIHVVVVDPGVGTSRRPILVEAAGQYFIGPDNGVFSMVFAEEKHRVRVITDERYFHHPVSRTFHGRDIFAPVAGHLGKGVTPARFGRLITDHLRANFEKPVRTGKRVWTGAILKIDHFGNLITNFHVREFPDLATRPFELGAGLVKIRRLALNYSECEPGELAVIVGSSGYLEVAANQASAARKLGCGTGAPVELTLY